ncbi:MAG: hypothetical protein Q9187_005961 [Circinaria calcarea]
MIRRPALFALPLLLMSPRYLFFTPSTPSELSSHSNSLPTKAPTYHSSARLHPLQRAQTSTPTPTFAPGFRRAYTNTVSDISNHRFNISEWSSVTDGPQARHYQAVAHRRATLENMDVHAFARNLTAPPPCSSAIVQSSIDNNIHMNSTVRSDIDIDSEAARYPHEDPVLVGPHAAQQARERRLYLEKHESEQLVLRQENKSWDFMLSQMTDWRERERSWENFRRDVGRTRMLGRRLGL